MTLLERCKKEFGTTSDPLDAGYILPDGSMLNFKRSPVWRDGPLPHGAISRCLPEYGEISYDKAIIKFMNDTGGMRMMVNPGAYTFFEGVANKRPTAEQARMLGKICRDAPGFRATMSQRAPCEWSVRAPNGASCRWSSSEMSGWPGYLRAWDDCKERLR